MESTVIIAIVTAVSSLILGIFTIVKDLIINKSQSVEKVKEELSKQIQKLQDTLEEHEKDINGKVMLNQCAVKIVLRDSIIQRCIQYKECGKISHSDFQRLLVDYKTYCELAGANGFVEDLVDQATEIYHNTDNFPSIRKQ